MVVLVNIWFKVRLSMALKVQGSVSHRILQEIIPCSKVEVMAKVIFQDRFQLLPGTSANSETEATIPL